MTLPMDIRLASDQAKFGFVFARRGIVPEACSSWFLPRVVGISQAAEWCYSGRVFPADRGARRRAGAQRPPGRRTAAGVANGIAREIADNTAPVSVALDAADVVADAGCIAPDGGPPRRLARDPEPGSERRRPRGRRQLPREATGGRTRSRSATGCRTSSRTTPSLNSTESRLSRTAEKCYGSMTDG